MDYVADTTFLVGVWRRQEWAIQFASAHADQAIGVPWVVLGEFWHGALRAGHDRGSVERFLRLGVPLLETRGAIHQYAIIAAALQQQGVYRMIGQNDLWIAAAALAAERPLVSRNRRHFGHIGDLELVVLED